MIAKDVMYHSKCRFALYRRSKQKSCVLNDNEKDFEKQVYGQVLAELALYMEQTANEEKRYILKLAKLADLADLANLCKTRVRELGGYTPNSIHTTKVTQRLMLHIENLKEFQESNNRCYLTSDDNVGTVLKTFYERKYNDEAFVLSNAAKVIRLDVLLVDCNFDGNFTKDC